MLFSGVSHVNQVRCKSCYLKLESCRHRCCCCRCWRHQMCVASRVPIFRSNEVPPISLCQKLSYYHRYKHVFGLPSNPSLFPMPFLPSGIGGYRRDKKSIEGGAKMFYGESVVEKSVWCYDTLRMKSNNIRFNLYIQTGQYKECSMLLPGTAGLRTQV